MGSLAHEAFACLFLNAKNEHLGFEIMFHGSIDRTHVHAREVLRRGLELNAAAIMFATTIRRATPNQVRQTSH